MRLPDDLRRAIDSKVETLHFKTLRAARSLISDDYRRGHNSEKGFRDPTQLLSYLATRMPATFGACSTVLQEIRSRLPTFSCRGLLDLGAGPATAAWAALDAFEELSQLYLVEREPDAIEIGRQLSKNSLFSAWETACWVQANLDLSFDIPSVDLAIFSYSYGELERESAASLIQRLWDRQIPMVAVIEPGTPKGFERIRALREFILCTGARLIAPCPHAAVCPMSASDWCHFAARIERTRLHRQLKEGTLGYEDEKFSYLVYAHPQMNLRSPPIAGRVVRSPHKGKGHVRLTLCKEHGFLQEEVISRSDRKRYRSARDANWGSAWM